jgi:biopolymer transport protein ExbD
MAMAPQQREDDTIIDINTTPLIDVMLVLLIMLIITIPVQMHSVQMDMPRDVAAVPPQKPEIIDLDIDFDGTISWNGAVVPTRAALEERLRAAAAANPQPELHLTPHRLVKYASVAMVLAEAQRLGVTRIGFVGNERFVE